MKKRKGEIPDCEECLPPLDEKNKDVYTVYSLVCNQVIVSAGGDILDVQISAVEAGIKRLHVEHYRQDEVFRRVVALIRSNLKGYRQERIASEEAAKLTVVSGTRNK